MKLNIRRLNNEDYSELVKWWKDWGFKAPNKDFLPENGTGGIIVMDENNPVCAGFLYTSNSKVAWINLIISNKNYRKKPQRKKALLLLIKSLLEICKNTNIKYIYSNNNNKHLVAHFEFLGFTKTTDRMTELIKII